MYFEMEQFNASLDSIYDVCFVIFDPSGVFGS